MAPRSAFASFALLAGLCPGQGGTIVGLVRSHDGRPVAGAEALLLADPDHDLPVLEGWVRAGPVAIGASDPAGTLRMRVPARSGTLLLRGSDGLGAVLPWVSADAPFRASLEPMAELDVVGAEGQEVELHAAVDDPRLGRRHLPPLTGCPPRLPPGGYEIWLRSGERWTWTRIELRPGERRELELPKGAPRRLSLEPGFAASAFPVGWPDVRLLHSHRPTALLLVDTPLRVGIAGDDGTIQTEWLPVAATHWQARPSGARHSEQTLRASAAGAVFWVLVETAAGWQPACQQHAGDDGMVRLRLPERARWQVVALAPGRAPTAIRELPPGGDPEVRLPAGRPLQVQCRDHSGAGVAHAILELRTAEDPALVLRVRADERGIALVPAAPEGPLTLLVIDDRYANATTAVAADADTVHLTLAAGTELVGRVVLPGAVPAAGAAVSLRDPTGRLRPQERTVRTDTSGRFRFGGLPEAGRFVLFAQQLRDGRTWSARLSGAQPGGPDCTLELRNEDPALPGGSGR